MSQSPLTGLLMRLSITLIALLLATGCSGGPTLHELRSELSECRAAPELNCDAIVIAINQKIEEQVTQELRNAERSAPMCPAGYTAICDSRLSMRCATRHKRRSDYVCRKGDVTQVLKGL